MTDVEMRLVEPSTVQPPFGPGAMARLIAQADWSQSPIGRPEAWPQSLKAALGFMLPAAAQIVLFWGPEFVALYNDAYAPTIGDKHPRALGRPARENWAELWGDLEPLLKSVRDTGQTVSAKDRPFYIERHGYPETVYFDISYSAVLDESGVGGVLCIVNETTVRIRAEERLKRVLETDAVGVLFFSHEGVVIDANEAFLLMTGYDRGEIERGELNWRRMTPEEWVGVSVQQMEKLASTGRIGPYEKQYIMADGSLRWMLFAGRDLGDGTIAEYCIDISDAKQSDEALRQSESRYRNLISASNQVLYRHNADWSEMRQLTGGGFLADTDEADPDWFQKYIHPDDQPHVREAIDEAIKSKGLFELEHRVIREDGTLGWTQSRSVPILDEHGEVVEWFGSANDTTARNEAQESLRAESHNLEILNRTGAAIAGELELETLVQLVTDAATELSGAAYGAFFYKVTDGNGEARMLHALSGADMKHFEAVGMADLANLSGPAFAETAIVRCEDVTKDPRYAHVQLHRRPRDPSDITSYLAVPVVSRSGEILGRLLFGHPNAGRFKDSHERLVIGIAGQAATAMDNANLYGKAQHEIDQRMKAEQALTALNETLESHIAEEIERRSRAEEVLRQAQKMETVGQLSGGIAHDFNNLLQVIQGNLSLLDRSLPQSEEKLRRSVTNALSGTERAAALTRRLLAFSRRQPLASKAVDVNRLIDDMTDLLHRTLGETIVVETHPGRNVPAAQVDKNQLENAILNLAINARDAMPNGGRLEISTDVSQIADEALEAAGSSSAYVRIRVRDDGFGMNSEVLERAVEPFFSTKDVGQGTGLGLSTVYGFVRQSGGHFILNSREGEGTTAEILLPSTSETAAIESLSEPGAFARGHGERILLCEDDEDVRFFSTETLRDLGYEVIEAHDATSALAALAEHGRVDLLFTDVVLPGGRTGADLAREARKLQPDLNVLFTTGYARSALDGQPTGEKRLQLLLKPFGVEALAAKIREVLG